VRFIASTSRFLVELDHLQHLLGAFVGIVAGRPGTSRTRSGSPGDHSTAQRMFSNTDRRPNRFDTWKLRAQAQAVDLDRAAGRRCARRAADLAAAGPKRPLIRLNSVDLPAPLGPMMATRSPAFTCQAGAADDLGLAEALAQVAQFERGGGRRLRFRSQRPPCA
jgi:hypothetical protein